MTPKDAKLSEAQISAALMQYVATRMGTGQLADAQKTGATLQNFCMEAWNVFQDFLAAVHAGIEANTGTVWADPVNGFAAAVGAAIVGSSSITTGNTIGAALAALLKALPQSGATTQGAAIAAITQAIAGTGILGPVGSAITALVPVAISDWSQVIPALQAGFTTIGGTPPASPATAAPLTPAGTGTAGS